VLLRDPPDPDRPVPQDDDRRRPLDAPAHRLGGFDGPPVGRGVGVAEGPALRVQALWKQQVECDQVPPGT
jgi:hypothetical protein